jgi:hypothetical protein
VQTALEFISATNEKLNGPVYPKGSNHDCGCLSPNCQWCVGKAWCMWFLGLADETGQEREFPYITESEQERNLHRSDRFEFLPQPDAKINDW